MPIDGLHVARSVRPVADDNVQVEYRVHNKRPSPVDLFVARPDYVIPEWEFVPEGAFRRFSIVVSAKDLEHLEVRARYDANQPQMLI